MRRVIDSHVHLEGYDEAVIDRAKESGVDAIVAVGGNIESSIQTLGIAERHPGVVYPGIGVHPADALKVDVDEALRFVAENACRTRLIGEIGLDYAYPFAKPPEVRERQRRLYAGLLDAAAENGLPVSVHSRSAYRDSLELLRSRDVAGAVFHWYDGPLKTLRGILDSGYYISATPAAEYSKGHRAVLAEAPMERILVETDSPVYLRRLDRRSEPADVWLTVHALAELKGMEPGEVARVATRNTETLFRVAP
ncbi:TatD family hydrolase [Candidatus Bathyarchaeota archaeon]|nr:TatD family hydrolase [Candidatus Bathyarchaeota archaeon]